MSLVNEIGRLDFGRREDVPTSPQIQKEQSGNSSFLDILKNIQNSGQILINENSSKIQEDKFTEKNNPEMPNAKTDALAGNENKLNESSSESEAEEFYRELEKKEKAKLSHNAYLVFGAKIEKATAKLKEVLASDETEDSMETNPIVKLVERGFEGESNLDFRDLVESAVLKKSAREKLEEEIHEVFQNPTEDFEYDNEDDFSIDDPRFLDSENIRKIVKFSENEILIHDKMNELSSEEFSTFKNRNTEVVEKNHLKGDLTGFEKKEHLLAFSEKSEIIAEKIKDNLGKQDPFEKQFAGKDKDVDVSFLDKSKWQIRKEKEIDSFLQERFKKDEIVEASRINSLKDSSTSGEREKGSFEDRRSNQFFINNPIPTKDKNFATLSTSENLLKSEKFQKSMNELVRQAKLNIVENGKSSAQISLHPKELGKVLLNVTIDKDKVEGKIFVESEAVRSAVSAEMASLKHELKSVGLHLENIQVEVGGNGGFLNSTNDGQSKENREELFFTNGNKVQTKLEENGTGIEVASLNLLDIKV